MKLKLLLFVAVFSLSMTMIRPYKKTLTLLFDANASELTEEHRDALLRVYYRITENNKRKIDSVFVGGHASREGKKEDNFRLSAERAVSVSEYLHSVDTTLLISERAFGSTEPNKDHPGKNSPEYDRRAEVIFFVSGK